MTCTEDPKAKDIGYGVPVTGGDSAYRLQVPTFSRSDALAAARRTSSRCRSKARSAIMLGGHGGDAVTWLTETLDGWETAAGYSETGVPAVKAFIDANPIAADFGKTWDAQPAGRLVIRGADDGARRSAAAGLDAQLPASC